MRNKLEKCVPRISNQVVVKNCRNRFNEIKKKNYLKNKKYGVNLLNKFEEDKNKDILMATLTNVD